MDKQRIIIFGASKGGERFLRRCGDMYEVCAFSDNDLDKQGSFVSGISVVPPSELSAMNYDQIIIASMFGQSIKEALVNNLGISAEHIQFAPKSALSPNKTYRPFEDEKTLDLARDVLGWLGDELSHAGIPYLLDHGTLLGLIRDQDLLPWDDDLDLSVPADYIHETLEVIAQRAHLLPGSKKLNWSGEVVIDTERNRTMGLILSYEESNALKLRKFAASIWFMFREEDQVVQYINKAQSRYFDSLDSISYRGRNHPVPSDVHDYLTYHYGDWRVPVRDMSLEDICNYCPPPRHTRRDILFGSFDKC